MEKKIEKYGEGAFFPVQDGKLSGLSLPDDGGDNIYDVEFPKGIKLDSYSSVFASGCHQKVHSVVILEGETEIPHHFLNGGFELESVTLPVTLKRIGSSAFYNCYHLGKIDLPEGLERIDHGAFQSCKALTEVIIPDSVKVIDTCAFCELPALRRIVLPSKLEHLGNHVFDKELSEECLHYYENGYYIGNRETDYFVFYKAVTGPKEIIIHPECRFIYDSAFLLNNNIEKVKLPSGIREIGHSSFGHCSNLNSINMPKDLVYINERAFEYCNSLTKIAFCKKIEKIDNCAFYRCNGIKTIRYKGSSKDWKSVKKGYDWIPEKTTIDLICGDGTLRRDEGLSRYKKKAYFGLSRYRAASQNDEMVLLYV